MSSAKDKEETKCIAVNLPVSLVVKIEAYRDKLSLSKNAALVELIQKGLNLS